MLQNNKKSKEKAQKSACSEQEVYGGTLVSVQ